MTIPARLDRKMLTQEFIVSVVAALVGFAIVSFAIDRWKKNPTRLLENNPTGSDTVGSNKFDREDGSLHSPEVRLRVHPQRTNYVSRHWRGELSLPVSYWINGFLGNVVIAIAVAAISASVNFKDEFYPLAALAAVVGMWLAFGSITVWQFVGTWRSATFYQLAKPRSWWGGVAKIVIVLGVIRVVSEFMNIGAPQLGELYQIHLGDQEVGKYQFRVVRGGEALEFSGGITFGAAKDLERFANAMSDLKYISLHSHGGRVFEAKKMAEIIKRARLSTYVANDCQSACTIIFLSGQSRVITSRSRIGFHQLSFAGMTNEDRKEAIADQERMLREFGVSVEFARRASATSPDKMWFPTTQQLLSERVATRLVD